MKKLVMLLVVAAALISCKTSNQAASSAGRVVSDSTQYDIIILDPGFDMWYTTRYMPSMDNTDEYYRQWNIRAVNNWNDYFMRGRYRRAVNDMINYSATTDYGVDVNRKLYYYFKYCEEKYRIPLLR